MDDRSGICLGHGAGENRSGTGPERYKVSV
jgi:hypothetical protein